MLTLLIALTFCGTMIYAALSDLLFMKISNIACLFLAAGFILFAPITGLPLQTILLHLAVGAVALIVCFGLFFINAMGGGDAKLISATALWAGFSTSLVQYLLISAIAGGILTIIILLLRKLINRSKIAHIAFLYRLTDPTIGIPYGIALAFAGLWIYPQLSIAG
ncbi:A24 family peptidase [Pseudochrobactrum kiredjianiae]|uniref:Prepilin peptidase n=1 Tax=Pseudochrobactrum kiredjianiae TaxID=386305 RepID=A0ABW3V695_9HYPH|nr:prepilin peptidase [Pseudochrobactrum kiredjianiae]MDM7849681.1 prepilin peptidase [Pseudochrobactrum kiredjianiae]